jgi:hypothetical protein
MHPRKHGSAHHQEGLDKRVPIEAAGHRPTRLAGTIGGERQQASVISSNDGKQAASSPT